MVNRDTLNTEKQGYKGMYTDVAVTNKRSLRVQEKASFTKLAEVDDPKRKDGVKSAIFRKVF